MSNSQGTARGNLETFDKLPPTARRALANANFDWAETNIYRAWLRGAKGFKTGADIARAVARWDKDAHARDVKKGKVAP
jgi:Family of unknown function (DUF6525)